MRKVILFWVLGGVGMAIGLTKPGAAETFADLYAESLWMSRVQTHAYDGSLRVGERYLGQKLDLYGVTRGAGDTKTQSQGFTQVYNDNMVFLGVGADYAFLIPGVRFTVQVGHSWDLSDKIHREGFDFRAGALTYHEHRWAIQGLLNELYSEWLYVHRYRNFFGSLQLRTLHQTLDQPLTANQSLTLGPIITFAGGVDSGGLDYNRYAELRLGARARYQGPVQISIEPYWVVGSRWQTPTSLPHYEEFRLLMTVYCAI